MKINELKDEHLKIFLEHGLPIEIHRDFYVKNNKLAGQLKGFRANTAPIKILVQTSFKLIRKDENSYLINRCSDFYDSYKKMINEEETKLISNGYPESFAKSESIRKGYNSKFLPVYFVLEETDQRSIDEIKKNWEFIQLIKSVCNTGISKIVEDIKEEQSNNIKDSKKDLEKFITEQNRKNEKLQKTFSNDFLKIAQYEELKEKNNQLLTNEIKAECSKDLKAMQDKIKKICSESIDSSNIKKQIDSLSSEIDSLRKIITADTKEKMIDIETKSCDEYETNSDKIEYVIGDIVDGIDIGKYSDAFSSFLAEAMLSNKPIICSSKNSIMFTEIVSSLISGNNYHILNCDNNTSESALINTIKSLPSVDKSKVILIRNKFDIYECGKLLHFIKERPNTEKYIFEVSSEKVVTLMPEEVLEDFLFCFIPLKINKIEYQYLYDFSETKIYSKENKAFTNYIKSLGLDFSDYSFYSNDYSGILAISIIPFLSLHDHIEVKDLIIKILDVNIRKKCEAIFDE